MLFFNFAQFNNFAWLNTIKSFPTGYDCPPNDGDFNLISCSSGPIEPISPNELVVETAGEDSDVDEVVDVSRDSSGEIEVVEMVEQPAKVMRIGSMVKQLLDEVRQSKLDEQARTRLAEIHNISIKELAGTLSPDLVGELERITLPFTEEAPSEAELRIAQAQLVGWLEGLFHGIQATLFAQQMAMRNQIQSNRMPGGDGGPSSGELRPGTYL